MAETKRYLVPAAEVRVEDTIQRSRFIASLACTDTPHAAKVFIDRVSAEFADASHNCMAFLCGPPATSAAVGMSDDGEPHGTAGRPMLNILTHSGVGDVAVVVTRYFGGVKLGKGGLVRAYSGAVQQALDAAGTVEKISWVWLKLKFVYPLLDPLKRRLTEFEAEIQSEEFTDSVMMGLRLPRENVQGFERMLTDLSNGSAEVEYERDGDSEG